MKKLIFIFLICLIVLTGCNVKYNSVIYSKNKIVENIEINIPNSYFDVTSKEEIEEEVKAIKTNPIFKKYKIISKQKKDNVIINFSKKYNSLSEYSKSIFYKELFESVTVIENELYSFFETVGDYYHDKIYGSSLPEAEFDSNDTKLKNITVKIQLMNKVLETNADKKNEKDNIYTWQLKPGRMEKSIFLKFSHKKRYDVLIKTFIKENIILFILIVSISILIAIILLYYIFKSNWENRL